MENKMMEEAINLAENGIPVMLLKPKGKEPLTPHGIKDATTDISQIKKWFIKWPNANIGVPMGVVSGMIGVDIDYKDGCREDFIQGLPRNTVIQKSPNGGHHAFFKYANGTIKNNLKLEKGATVRSDGYYFVVAPSELSDGKKYEFVDFDFIKGEVLEIPQWFQDIADKSIAEKQPFSLQEKISRGEQHIELFKFGCSLRAKGMSEAEIVAAFIAANNRLEQPAPVKNLEKLAIDVCKRYERGNDYEEDDSTGWEGFSNSSSNGSDTNGDASKTSGDSNSGGDTKTEKGTAKKKKKAPQEAIDRLGREILDCRFKLVMHEEATIIYNIKNIDKKEVIICNNDEYILKRLKQNIYEKTGKAHGEDFVKWVYRSWRLSTEPLKKDPLSFTWSNQDDWSFKKLDFFPEEGGFVAWKELLVRLSNPEDFMAFIWSIFEEKSKSRQYLYLYDPNGQGGKSTVLRVLGRVLGHSYTAINNSFISGGGNRWLMGNLYGKRLVVWPDVKNTKFCMTEQLRNITSGDDVIVEFKGQQPFTTRAYLKLIMASNHEPTISSGGADASRLIRINIEENKTNKNDPEWENKLYAELPMFLWECKKWYTEKCKNHGDIKLGDNTNELVGQSTHGIEERLEDIVNRKIELDPNACTFVGEWVQLCNDERLNKIEIGNLKDYLMRLSKSVAFKRKLINGKKQSVYIGIKIRKTSHVGDELF